LRITVGAQENTESFSHFFLVFLLVFRLQKYQFFVGKKKPQAQVFGVQNPEEKDKTTKKTSKGI